MSKNRPDDKPPVTPPDEQAHHPDQTEPAARTPSEPEPQPEQTPERSESTTHEIASATDASAADQPAAPSEPLSDSARVAEATMLGEATPPSAIDVPIESDPTSPSPADTDALDLESGMSASEPSATLPAGERLSQQFDVLPPEATFSASTADATASGAAADASAIDENLLAEAESHPTSADEPVEGSIGDGATTDSFAATVFDNSSDTVADSPPLASSSTLVENDLFQDSLPGASPRNNGLTVERMPQVIIPDETAQGSVSHAILPWHDITDTWGEGASEIPGASSPAVAVQVSPIGTEEMLRQIMRETSRDLENLLRTIVREEMNALEFERQANLRAIGR